jgi:hypothetical protein
MSIIFLIFNRHLLRTKYHLLKPPLHVQERRDLLRRAFAGLVPYALAVSLAALSPYATLGLCAAVAGYYALPTTTAPSGHNQSSGSNGTQLDDNSADMRECGGGSTSTAQ